MGLFALPRGLVKIPDPIPPWLRRYCIFNNLLVVSHADINSMAYSAQMTGCWPQRVLRGAFAYVLLTVVTVYTAELIDCPDCTKEVSSRAVFYPHCGCPGEAVAKEALLLADSAGMPTLVELLEARKQGGDPN